MDHIDIIRKRYPWFNPWDSNLINIKVVVKGVKRLMRSTPLTPTYSYTPIRRAKKFLYKIHNSKR